MTNRITKSQLRHDLFINVINSDLQMITIDIDKVNFLSSQQIVQTQFPVFLRETVFEFLICLTEEFTVIGLHHGILQKFGHDQPIRFNLSRLVPSLII